MKDNKKEKTREPTQKDCPECEGRGFDDRLFSEPNCPECGGTGKIPNETEADKVKK